MLSYLLWLSLPPSLVHAVNIPFLAPPAVSTPTSDWACDIRSWTRAPDLYPGLVTLADARLAYNGSDCKDIVGWQVGLRFKERAIIKIKSKNVDKLPERPRHSFNATKQQARQESKNDVYSPGRWNSFGDDDYNVQMRAYNDAMQNRSLWEVHGAERVAFDVLQALPLQGGEKVDTVESFAVHVPLTNFPPILAWSHDNMGGDSTEQMIRAETMFEYYHLIKLANGSTVDLPAGRSGFLSAPSPVTAGKAILSRQLTKTLMSPREGEFDKNRHGGPDRKDGRFPECDAHNLAQFIVTMEPVDIHNIQGSNVTLNITLTRTGNGTEIPVYLEVTHKTVHNYTFARNYLSSEDYEAVVNPKDRGMYYSSSGSQAEQILAAKTVESLKKERERQTIRSGCVEIFDGGGRGQNRHHFESKEVASSYNVLVNMTVGELDLPSFQTTFQDYISSINIQVGTTFSCLNLSSSDTACPPRWDAKLEGLDAEWQEYHLPDICQESKRLRTHWHQPHKGTMDFNILPSFPLTNDAHVRHYLDGGATGPVLSLKISDQVTYPALSQVIRPEQENELKRSRYGSRGGQNRGPGGRLNPGVEYLHAAKMWQKKENPDVQKAIGPMDQVG